MGSLGITDNIIEHTSAGSCRSCIYQDSWMNLREQWSVPICTLMSREREVLHWRRPVASTFFLWCRPGLIRLVVCILTRSPDLLCPLSHQAPVRIDVTRQPVKWVTEILTDRIPRLSYVPSFFGNCNWYNYWLSVISWAFLRPFFRGLPSFLLSGLCFFLLWSSKVKGIVTVHTYIVILSPNVYVASSSILLLVG